MIRSRSGRCVAFDLDDTLYDEIEFVRSGYAAVADVVRQQYQLECGEFLRQRLESRLLAGAFQCVVAEYELCSDAIELMVNTYRFHLPRIKLRDGIVDVLRDVKQRDGVLGCITDGRSVTQRNKLAALGLDGVFSVVLISEETGHEKPAPFNFRTMMHRIAASEYWYVADNPSKDFAAPNALGWKTIGVQSAHAIHAPRYETLTPDYLPQRTCGIAELRWLLLDSV